MNPVAIKKAREEFGVKNPKLLKDINEWDDITFLNKAKLTINNKITKTTIILLGKPESTHHLDNSTARLSWILKSENNIEKDYEHYLIPLVLNTDRILNKIRNLEIDLCRIGHFFQSKLICMTAL
ncbi:MAG: hypothetical protein U5K00_08180 [Melioribacteraceae bacterium]|nr:hypothetical protein [Melioribacteraceae bacterium]